jgi:hypothetical protein
MSYPLVQLRKPSESSSPSKYISGSYGTSASHDAATKTKCAEKNALICGSGCETLFMMCDSMGAGRYWIFLGRMPVNGFIQCPAVMRQGSSLTSCDTSV